MNKRRVFLLEEEALNKELKELFVKSGEFEVVGSATDGVEGLKAIEEKKPDFVITELGSGEGNNWWCVVYPPLCFTSAPVKYEYKSKIIEIIKDFKAKRGK